MDGQPDEPTLVGERSRDSLADPPRRVRRELVAHAIVELLDRANEPEVALLDEVEERYAGSPVVPRDRHHEPEVALDEPSLGRLVACVLAPRELSLLVPRQQTAVADLPHVELQRIPRLGIPRVVPSSSGLLDGRRLRQRVVERKRLRHDDLEYRHGYSSSVSQALDVDRSVGARLRRRPREASRRMRYWNVAQAPRRASNIRYTCHSVSNAESALRASRQSANFGRRPSPRAITMPWSIARSSLSSPTGTSNPGLSQRIRERAECVPVERLRRHEPAVLVDVLRRRHSSDAFPEHAQALEELLPRRETPWDEPGLRFARSSCRSARSPSVDGRSSRHALRTRASSAIAPARRRTRAAASRISSSV